MSDTNISTIGAEADKINAAIAETNIKFNISNAEVLAKFKEGGREIVFDDDGNPFSYYDQEALPLKDAITRFSSDTDGIADRRTLPRNGSGGGRAGVVSKADFTTPAEKIAAIKEMGLEAYERLPLTAPSTKETLYKEDFYRLPLSEKYRLTKADPDYFSKLKSKPTGQPYGGFIAHDKIAKQQAIRPSSKNKR